MEKELQSNGLLPPPDEHLKPLSVCLRTVTCNQKDSLLPPKPRQFQNIHIKVQLDNHLVKKRKLEDCSDYRSPKIRPITPNAISPDLGCFMDFSSPSGWDSTCPPSPLELYKKTQAPVRDLREVLDTSLDRKHVDLRCTLDSKSQSLSANFDYDVDDIFCLNPLGQEEQKKLLPVSSVTSNVAADSEGCPAETVSEQQLHQEALLCPQRLSFLDNDLREILSQPLPEPRTSTGNCLEGVVKEGWDIGTPRFESSVCEGSPAAEHRNPVSKVQEDSSFVDEFSTSDNSLWQTTLPLQVQVKSKVVVPSKLTFQPSGTLKDHDGRQNRPSVYSRKSEWQHQSRQYVDSVTSHMMENEGTTRGVMTELLDLMTSVSRQSSAHGAGWQHPADFTCRNYQRRFHKETPLMSLSDWQQKNHLTYKRFFKIPKIFTRSSTKHLV